MEGQLTTPNPEIPNLRPRPRWLRVLKRVTHSPLVNVCLGIALALIGILEILEDIFVELESLFEAHHAILLFGIVTGLRGLAEFVEGLEVFEHGYEARVTKTRTVDSSSI
jgi:hypothetical protein